MNSVSNATTAVLQQPRPRAGRVSAQATASFAILVLLGVFSKGVGFVREMVLAAQFGASGPMDAYLVAQTLPSAAQRVFDELLGASLLPLFASWCLAAGEAAAWSRLKRVVGTILVWSTLLVIAAILFSGPLVRVLAPGLGAQEKVIAARALAILLPGVACGVAGSIFAALLNYHRRFLCAAGFAVAGNALALVSILLFAGRIGVYSAAAGMTAGAALLLLQWFFLPGGRGALTEENPAATRGEFFALAAPLAAGIALFNFIPLVERFLSSWLPAGGIALLNYAFKLDWLAYLVLVVPITTMIFPRLAAAGAAGDTQKFLGALHLALKGAWLALLPAMLFLTLAAPAVIALIYERGSFTTVHTAGTASILRIYVAGLPGAAATLILFYALYALRQPAGRVAAGIAGLLIALAFGWPAVRAWGAAGIAATHAVNFTALSLLLGWYAARSLGRGWWRPLASFAARSAAAAIAALIVGRALLRWMDAAGFASFFRGSLELAAALIAVALFLFFCVLLRVDEVRALAAEIVRSLRDRPWLREGT
ncbi:MAG TPA: lipid II flippase MurJ [Candidatus Acidoferrales bacterium]|nr:lipid II flippase MurJ [Candidatus Acidoferrales bacterium]